MEPTNPPTIVAKRLWHIVKVFCYMLRKSISKRKLILDLHLLLKRSKLAGKSLGKHLVAGKSRAGPTEFQFSCTNTPLYAHYFRNKQSRRGRHRREEFDSFDAADIAAVFQMMSAQQDSDTESAAPSALPTPSPMMVRQLRITDSPFPVDGNEVVGVGVIDEEAEKFIKRFYEQLMRQQLGSECSTPEQGYFRRGI